MPSNGSNAALRTALEDSFSGWLDEVETLLADARELGREELANTLNQASRRLRQSDGFDELAATLTDASTPFCKGAAVLRVAEGKARGERIRGVDAAQAERFAALEIPLASAAALAGAVETRDPVTAVSSETEVSAELLAIAGHGEKVRVSIFPVQRDNGVEALLYCWGDVSIANLELLAQVAGLCLAPPPPPPPVVEAPPLFDIAPAPVPGPAPAPAVEETKGDRDWDRLTSEDQRVHLSAQRFARVRIAEMRLHEAEAVHAGRMHRDLYGALQVSIDKARETFRHSYMATCPSMVDYVHLELVRTLAHENPHLLGEEYPGPLV